MSETPPDPADVHTGTDRVELTDAEKAALDTWARERIYHCPCRMRCMCDDSDKVYLFDAVESILAARVQALTAERTGLAEKVGRLLEGSQELCAERDAARAEADELRREIQAVAGGALVEEAETSVRRIHAEVERDVARQALTSADAMNRHWDEINAERDRLQAELVAANARADALSDELTRQIAVVDELEAEIATLREGVVAFAAVVNQPLPDALRAALTPEGTE